LTVVLYFCYIYILFPLCLHFFSLNGPLSLCKLLMGNADKKVLTNVSITLVHSSNTHLVFSINLVQV